MYRMHQRLNSRRSTSHHRLQHRASHRVPLVLHEVAHCPPSKEARIHLATRNNQSSNVAEFYASKSGHRLISPRNWNHQFSHSPRLLLFSTDICPRTTAFLHRITQRPLSCTITHAPSPLFLRFIPSLRIAV